MKRLTVLGAVVVAVAVAAGISYATIPDASGVVHACYQKNSGAVRVVDSASDCSNSELATQWSQTGQAGPPPPPGGARTPRARGGRPAHRALRVCAARPVPQEQTVRGAQPELQVRAGRRVRKGRQVRRERA